MRGNPHFRVVESFSVNLELRHDLGCVLIDIEIRAVFEESIEFQLRTRPFALQKRHKVRDVSPIDAGIETLLPEIGATPEAAIPLDGKISINLEPLPDFITGAVVIEIFPITLPMPESPGVVHLNGGMGVTASDRTLVPYGDVNHRAFDGLPIWKGDRLVQANR